MSGLLVSGLILFVAALLVRRIDRLERRIAHLESARNARAAEAVKRVAGDRQATRASGESAAPSLPQPATRTGPRPQAETLHGYGLPGKAASPQVTHPPEDPDARPSAEPARPVPPVEAGPAPAVSAHLTENAAAVSPLEEPPQSSAAGEKWKRLERQLIQNWTGILGAGILVAGVAFIGISVALHVSPVLRTAMITAGAAALAVISRYLKTRPDWAALATWLRSSGAAIFLFACFGAGALPGLQWIENPWLALGALVLGIGVNLYFAWSGASQAFSSLHVVLSLIPLFIIPQSRISLLVATLVALAGVGLAYRGRWDRHLLTTLLAYSIFHGFWALRLSVTADASGLRYTGLACAIVVGIASALVHYRHDYRSEKLAKLPFAVHLTNWGMMGFAGLLYSQQSAMKGFALVAGGLCAFFLARHGRSIGVRWVYLTDTLVAQGLLVLGILSFHRFVFDPLLVLSFLFVETALFLRVVLSEDEELLTVLGLAMLHASAASLVLVGILFGSADQTGDGNLSKFIILLVSSAACTAIHVYFLRSHGEEFDSTSAYGLETGSPKSRTSIIGIFAGPIVIAGLMNLGERLWQDSVALVSLGIFALIAYRVGSRGLAIGVWFATGFTMLKAWGSIALNPGTGQTAEQLARLVPLALLSIILIRFAPAGSLQRILRRLAIYFLGAHGAIGIYFVAGAWSPLIPGVLWLMLSLAALEVSGRLRKAGASSVLHVGYAYVAGFLAQYVLVYMQAQAYLGPFPARLLVEIFGVAGLLYWWAHRPGGEVEELRSWMRVHPLFLEASLVLLVTAVLMEAPAQVRPIIWSGMAFACLAAPLSRRLASRFRFYSVLCFLGAAIDMSIVTSGIAAPNPRWFEHPGVTGTLTILLMIGWLIRSHASLELAGAEFPRGLGGLESWSNAMAGRIAIWVYYPFAASVALFLYWRFDHSVLTLLWSAEAFTLFVLSAVLREDSFRYTALAGMGACVVRLIAYDMAQADTLIRGLVFLGVGVLMLSMNSVYNRFRARFQ